MKLPNKAIIWPANLNQQKTRSEGRRVPKKIAVDSPRVEEIVEAMKRRNLRYEVVEGKALPMSWWEKTGYIIVEKDGMSKQEILHSVANELINLRRGRVMKK